MCGPIIAPGARLGVTCITTAGAMRAAPRNTAQSATGKKKVRENKSRPQRGRRGQSEKLFAVEKSVGGADPGRQGLGGWVKLPVGIISRQPTVPICSRKGARECS